MWNDDWDVFNSGYRYGPTSTTMITTDSQYTTAKNNNNYSYYFTGDGSSYKVTFNLEELTFKFEVIDTPSGPDYPETTIYIVGGESGWSLTEPLGTMTHLGNGIYVDTLTINTPIYLFLLMVALVYGMMTGVRLTALIALARLQQRLSRLARNMLQLSVITIIPITLQVTEVIICSLLIWVISCLDWM